MRKLAFFAAAGLMLGLASCTNDDVDNPVVGNPTDRTALQVEIFNEGLATRSNQEGIIPGGTPWEDGDKIRLFTLDYDRFLGGEVVRYEGADFQNKEYCYVKTGKTWTHTSGEPVTLSNIKARLYAYSPSFPTAGNAFYNGDNALNPKACPIVFNTPNKVDFLYGTHRNTRDGETLPEGDNTEDMGGSTGEVGTSQAYVDNKNPLVRLYMKHAQTNVKIRLVKEALNPDKKYSGKGIVTKLEVMQLKQTLSQYGNVTFVPADGEHGAALPSKGIIDITRDADNITPTEWAIPSITDLIDGQSKKEFTLNPSVAAGATPQWSEADVLLAPCKPEMVRGFHITVDGVDFYVPCSTADKPMEWKAGFQYTYELVLTGKALEMVAGDDGEVVTVKPWNDGGTTPGEF